MTLLDSGSKCEKGLAKIQIAAITNQKKMR